MELSLVLILLATLIISSVVGEIIFRKYNIPDVLVLILFGVLLGSIFNIVKIDVSNIVVSVFSALALIIVMFDGGLSLNLKEIIKNTPQSLKLSILNFIILLFFSLSLYYLLKFFGIEFLDLSSILIIASILGGTSGIVVVPLLDKLNISEKIKNILFLESTITDSLTIVVTYSLVLYFITSNESLSSIFQNIVASLSISIVLGLVLLILWISFIDKFLHLKEIKNYKYLIILATLIIIYVISNYLGGSPAITIFVFALLLGNLYDIKDLLNLNIKNKIISKEIFLMNVQFSFLIKTFFFFLIGALASLDLKILLLSIFWFLIVVVSRFITIFILFRNYSIKDKLFLSFFTPKGLAASILAIYASQLLNNNIIVPLIFDIILISIIVAAIDVAIYEKLTKKEKIPELKEIDNVVKNNNENKELNYSSISN